MSQQNQVFQHFTNSVGQLNQLIAKLEVNVGAAHSVSPFEAVLPTKTVPVAQTLVQEEQQQPKQQEANPPTQKKEKAQKKQENNNQAAEKSGKEKEAKKEEKPAKKEEKPVKKEEKPAPKKEHEEAKEGAEPTDEDFQKVDIRVGRIIECWKHPESENLYCEKIDIGTEIRQIASGLQKFQPIENMSGLVLVMANLKVRKLAGFDSNGMVVCASNGDHSQVEILRPSPDHQRIKFIFKDSKVGERVFLEGQLDKFPQELQPVLNPKKKILETVLPGLRTDTECNATFLGKKWFTSTGLIKAQTLTNSTIS